MCISTRSVRTLTLTLILTPTLALALTLTLSLALALALALTLTLTKDSERFWSDSAGLLRQYCLEALAPQHLDRWRLDLVTPEAPLPMFPPAEDLAPRGCNSAGMYTAGGMYALPVTVAGTPVRCSGDTARLGEIQRRYRLPVTVAGTPVTNLASSEHSPAPSP